MDANANANAGGSTIAVRERFSGKLKNDDIMNKYNYHGKYSPIAKQRQDEVMNEYNYHGKHGTRAKPQTR